MIGLVTYRFQYVPNMTGFVTNITENENDISVFAGFEIAIENGNEISIGIMIDIGD